MSKVENITPRIVEEINALIEATPIVSWPIDKPVDYSKNNKIHTPESLARLSASMDKLGQIEPILVDRDGVIISGHGRRAAARSLGWKMVQVRVLEVDERRAKEIRLATNLTVNQKYDTAAITEEIRGLVDEGASFEDVGDSVGLDAKLRDLIAPDLTGALNMTLDAISKDIGDDVIVFQDQNDKRMREVDETPSPVTDALGFKKAKPAQLRVIRAFMAQVKEEVNIEDPAEALVAWIEEMSQ